ncbi:hypothetical protein PZ739_19425 [Pseudomonas kermanshahensis]|uniref:hypothetical protein n=1 Tax=Pseudomonas kermanshahensis TaxID=2745482 RepID=UPI0023DB8E44|nr:hypothetical protein [Pseudomonas kermanshahensis]WEL53993.1 hypothetical protein PZ739_19425 [Pseudomonas kermanshahensis]
MKGNMQALLRSLDLQPTVDKVQGGVALDFAQYTVLRDSADAKLYHLMGKVDGAKDDLGELQEACLRVSRLLQTSCLALRRLQLDYEDQCLAREVLESQLAYMRACLQRSLASFERTRCPDSPRR